METNTSGVLYYNNYIFMTFTVIDVDECVVKENSCDQICTNTDGTFECACDSGYVLDEDKISCISNE